MAINNIALKQGARFMRPPNLEVMAVPVEPAASSAYPECGEPPMQTPQTASDE